MRASRHATSIPLLVCGVIAAALLFTVMRHAPPRADTGTGRPTPLTATVAVMCSHGEHRVMFAVFTYPGDRTVIADKDNPLGFTSVEDLLQYAQTAATPRLYVQPCEGTTT